MADDREERIRARAQAIWEGEGRPHGQQERHWRQASAEVDAGGASDSSARSLGSAAQSDLIPQDAGQGSDRAGSLVDTGPSIGLAAGLAGGAVTGGLGNLSLGADVGHGQGEGSGEPGGMSSIGSGTEETDPRRDATAGTGKA